MTCPSWSVLRARISRLRIITSGNFPNPNWHPNPNPSQHPKPKLRPNPKPNSSPNPKLNPNTNRHPNRNPSQNQNPKQSPNSNPNPNPNPSPKRNPNPNRYPNPNPHQKCRHCHLCVYVRALLPLLLYLPRPRNRQSATCVIAYLMQEKNWTLFQAMGHVKGRRSVIYPNPGFQRQLLDFEKKLINSRRGTVMLAESM